ncbi:cysteine hydrolase family protein [Alicyclobacillus shizuokensis]|uniref:cysteine hydrolase family protein n=1 Tax=Alicyclobacillus shizuokensis TaxID=392014 RepID=UPI000832EDBD|nr:isochorismatase family cysteine hydrolase [Alicyclobacillus shizuokensis]MCL6625006.1 cysteine hydrolase [Alicyclobacillus shizuokensis]
MREYLDPAETALIIVDVQNDFCHEEGACAKRGDDVTAAQAIIPPLQALIEAARTRSVPIIFVQMTLDERTVSDAWSARMDDPVAVCAKGSWGTQFYKIAPQSGDIVVEKHRYSAFIGTELDMILRSLKRKSLVITGVATNVCVESTARDGFMMDYHVTLVEDACAAYNTELHHTTCENIRTYFGKVLRTSDVVQYWENTVTI